MEELEKHHDPLMGFYFSCPHCQQNYVSAECVQEHLTNCQMESSSSFMIPKITSYSSLNPQALDLNVNAEGFPIRHEIIKREPQDYVEDDYTDWQDENDDSTLSNPDDMHQAQDDPPSPHKLQPRRARQKVRILFDSDQTEDSNSAQDATNQQQAQPVSKILRDSVKNPNSTCTQDRYMCRYCPKTFPYPSVTYVHEESHTREPRESKYKYSCPTCGQSFRWPHSLVYHMKSHGPDIGFHCCYPGCPQTFKSRSSRWIHHKTHPVGPWNAFGRRGGFKNSNPVATKLTRQLLTHAKSISNKPLIRSIDKSPSDPNDKSSKNARSTNNWKESMKSQPPAQIILCSYPDCSMVFKSESSRWIHHKTHAHPNDKSSKNSQSTNYWKKSMKSQPPAKVIRCLYPDCSMVFTSTFKRWIHHKSHPKGRWNASGRRPGWNLRQNKTISPPKLKPENVNLTDNESIDNVSMPDLSIDGPMTPSEIESPSNLELDSVQQSAAVSTNESQDARANRLKSRKMKSQFSVKTFHCCYPGCPETFKSTFKRWIHHRIHPKGLWNVRGRRRGWNSKQKQETPAMPPTRPQENENVANNKSMESLSMPDLSVKGSMTRSVTKSPTNLELDNVRQKPGVTKDANIPAPTRRRGRKAQPGNEIEIMTAWGRKFKCDLCDKTFNTRYDAKEHRLLHFTEPQISCYVVGCSQMFFSRYQRLSHVKSVHHVTFRKGKPIIGKRLIAQDSAGHKKVPNASTARKPSQSPQKIQLNESPNPDQNIPQGSQTKDANIPAPTRRKGRRAKPGHEIEVMTPWGTKFMCDKCDKTFNTRFEVKDHRLLKHFDEPQISCYITGCSQMFFSRVERLSHLKSVHHVRFRNGKPFIGKRLIAPNKTGPRKVIAKRIISNASTARNPSQSPQKIQLNKSPDPDHNIPQGSQTRGLSPANNISFTCGICGDSYKDVSALKCHMMTSHVGPEESFAQELEVIGTPATNETTENSSVPAQQSAALNGAIILDSSNSNRLGKPRRRGRPAQPGDEIEITTAWGTRFKCDLCGKQFLTRMIARDHRLGHFDTPQIPCYMTGCSQMFFSRIKRVSHLKSVHQITFRNGRPFIGSKPLQLNITGPRKVIAKEISPNVNTARQHSQSPKKMELNKSPKSGQNATGAGGSQTKGLGPGQALLHTCGICDESFGNFDVLKCHMLTTHAHLDGSQAQEIDTPVDDSIGSDQYTCEEDPLSEQVTENQATSNLSGNLNAKATYKGSVPRYPIVMKGGKKYFYCGFPDCADVFTNRNARYLHHRKYHEDAYRSMLTNLAGHQLSEKTVNETLSAQPKENNSDDDKKTTKDMESPPDFPFVQVNGKKYFWCDVPDCGVVLTNLEARYLHYKKHQIKLEQVTSAQDSQGTDPKKRKLSQEGPKQYYNKRRKIIEKNEDEILGETLQPNQPEMAQVQKPNYKQISAQSSVQNDERMPAQLPLQTLAVVLDEDFEGDEEEEMLNLQNQSMDLDPLQFVDTDNAYSPMESFSHFDQDFNTENNDQTDSGHGSELSTEPSSCASNPALQCNISNPTSMQYKVVQRPSVAKERKSKGRPPLYASIEIGTRKLFCCDFPGCGGVFNSRRTMYCHTKRHRMGKRVKSKLKLTEDGTLILDSAEGCYVVD